MVNDFANQERYGNRCQRIKKNIFNEYRDYVNRISDKITLATSKYKVKTN